MHSLPSIQDVARESGFAPSTVSLALRHSPRVRPTTRTRIQEVAARLGYRPDPVVAGIAANRWKYKKGESGLMLAMLQFQHPQVRHSSTFYEQARSRAKEHGFGLTLFDEADYQNGETLSNVLVARGIRGLIIPRQPFLGSSILDQMKFSQLAVVAAGTGRQHHPFHTVAPDYFTALEVAVARLVARGYRSIGFATCAHAPVAEEDMHRIGAALAEQWRRQADIPAVPPFTGAHQDREGFLQWFHEHRPEVVIGLTVGIANFLYQAGYGIPEDVAFLALNCAPPVTGFHQAEAACTSVAVDTVIQGIRLHDWGIPHQRRRILLEPEWIEGQTAPPRR